MECAAVVLADTRTIDRAGCENEREIDHPY